MICQRKCSDQELCSAWLQSPVPAFAALTLNSVILNVVVLHSHIYSLVHLSWMEFSCFHDLSGVVHELDGPGDLRPGVDGRHGAHHEPPVVVLHLVLQEGGDPDVNVLEEVQDGISAK